MVLVLDISIVWAFLFGQISTHRTLGIFLQAHSPHTLYEIAFRTLSAHCVYTHTVCGCAAHNCTNTLIGFIRKTRTSDEKLIKDALPELYRFSFESICYIALDTRLGCMNVPLDPEISEMFEGSKAFLGMFSWLSIS